MVGMTVPPYGPDDPDRHFYQQDGGAPKPAPERPMQLTEDRVRLLIERAITESLHRHEHHLLKHFDTQFNHLYKTLESAFPGGDPHGHRLAHEKAIRDAEGWNRIKGELLSKLATSGLWAVGAWVLYLIWQAIVESVQK
jgi:hypothetical protein